MWSVVLSVVVAASAQGGPDTPPTTRVSDCTTGGCHAPITDHQVMHGPAAIGACDACHEYDDPAQHTFVLQRQGSDMCAFCHIGADTTDQPVLHKPFQDGDCTGCHNPHGGASKPFLKTPVLSDLCAQCHVDVLSGKYVHGPAAAGECLACHGAHAGSHKYLLPAEGRDLCLWCHEDMRESLKTVLHPHEPVEDGCLSCHKAHSSDVPAHLILPPGELCASCHEKQATLAKTATHPHSVVLEGEGCANCHNPHGSDHEALMKADPIGACLACHDKPVERPDGSTVDSVAEILAKGESLHGPVAQGQCKGCHQPHGSDHTFLLVANYTERFYEAYDPKEYALCFQCHDDKLADAPQTRVDTRFRNGDKNLHYVHVHRDEQGRTCRTCHATHASRNPKHVAETVQFGKWQLPLNYAPTETGGSCASGCHRPAYYDREHATGGILQPGEEAPW